MAKLTSKKIGLIFFVAIFLVGVAFIFFNNTGVVKYLRLKKQLDSLKVETQKIESVNEELRAEIDSLKRGDPAKIERIAREKYGMIRKGEKVYRMKEK
ncbi:MAG: septum formation initiator family protein [Ignavibacteriaceae bacterium]|nr:septum formation initiator family protein [Ignavibacteriaceae bacterium]